MGESEPEELQDGFARIEAAVEAGDTKLGRLGFGKLIRQVKTDPALSHHWAEQAGRIDRRAFELGVWPRFPVWLGNLVLLLGTLAGAAAIVVALRVPNRTLKGLALVASAEILFVSVHSLGHWVVGRLVGIRFVAYFLDGPFRIQPGLKTDYATYLRTGPVQRAWMHASGALASKVTPFVSLAFWPSTGAPGWAAWLILALGVGQILTDVIWSTKQSDWKRVRRELAVARAQAARAG